MDETFVRMVREAALRLATTSIEEDGAYIATSSTYPSGAYVTVRVTYDGRQCFVSDMGYAAHEAEMLGATPQQFSYRARQVADEFGIGFDNNSFFVVEVPLDRIEGAARTIATASLKAAVIVESLMAQQADDNDKLLLIDRLRHAFGADRVDTEVEVVGASGHKWVITGRAIGFSRPVYFDCGRRNHTSVVNIYSKFNDLKRLDVPQTGVVAILGATRLQRDFREMLEQTVDGVIEIESDDSTYQSFALAA